MDRKIAVEIRALERLVLRVVAQSRTLASMTQVEPGLLEELTRVANALLYTIQTLKSRLGLPSSPGKEVTGGGSSLDLQMMTPADDAPQKADENKTSN